MSNTELDPVDAEIVEESIVPAAEIDRYPGLRLEHGVGGFYDKAETLDALLDELPDSKGLIEFTGRALTIHGASLHMGEIDGRKTLYAVMEVTDHSTGENLSLSTGAAAVMRQLSRAGQKGWFPFDAKPYQVAIGKKGQTDPIHLGKVDAF